MEALKNGGGFGDTLEVYLKVIIKLYFKKAMRLLAFFYVK
jgi:hypothetical protein